jgi:integrase
LRSAEIERLEWSDIHIVERFIVVGASKAKTAGRRIVPVSDNLVEWLQPYAQQQGNVWQAAHDKFYEAQQDTAKAAGLKWKSNALRHSYASYRFALTNDAGRVAGECGNSAAVIHRHYRELVKKSDAERWFNMKPEAPANVLVIPAKAGL